MKLEWNIAPAQNEVVENLGSVENEEESLLTESRMGKVKNHSERLGREESKISIEISVEIPNLQK